MNLFSDSFSVMDVHHSALSAGDGLTFSGRDCNVENSHQKYAVPFLLIFERFVILSRRRKYV